MGIERLLPEHYSPDPINGLVESGIILPVSKPKAPKAPPKTGRLATTLSIIAICLSGSSWWLNYLTSLPAIFPKVELVARFHAVNG